MSSQTLRFSRKKIWTLLLVLCASLASLHGCSCGEGEIRAHSPLLHLQLPPEPSGVADYLLDFGPTAVGSTARQVVELQNRGGAPLTIEAAPSTLPFLQEFPALLTAGVGQRLELSFAFQPTEPGPFEALLTLETNEGGRARRIRLAGEGVPARLECEPAQLDLGLIRMGQRRTSTVVCTNPLEIPLRLGEGELVGDASGSYSHLLVGLNEGGELGAGAELTIELVFRAETLGRNEATLLLDHGDGIPLVAIELEAEVIHGSLAIEPEGCLDFGFVRLGEREELALQIRRLLDEELVLEAVGLEKGGPFSFHSSLPLSLADPEPRALHFAFEPTALGEAGATATLELRDRLGEVEPATICLRGYGGGSRLDCTPESLDFGQVAIGTPIVRRKKCIHRNETPPGEEAHQLLLEALSVEGDAFEAVIRNEDGSEGPREEGYLPDESFWIEVRFDPRDEELATGTILLETTAGPFETPLVGQGRDLPPCEAVISPPDRALRFGVVDRGRGKTLRFSVANQGESPCLLNDLALVEGSDPAFEVEAIESQELAPGASLGVDVRFAPTSFASSFQGEVGFWISDPANAYQRIQLSGEAAAPCLLMEPEVLDFGVVPPGCHSTARAVSLRNLCGRSLSVEAIGLEASEAFQITSRPALPHLLAPNWVGEIQVAFQPQAPMGEESGILWVEAGAPDAGVSERYSIAIRGRAVEGATRTDEFIQEGKKKVDILWVIDNSTSMGGKQTMLRQRLPDFLEVARRMGIDFHLAVTTSGTHIGRFPYDFPCPGGTWGGENGRFYPVDGSRPRILKADTPDLEAHWAENVSVGACVNLAEWVLEASRMALSHPLINETKDSRLLFNRDYRGGNQFQDGNHGFLRDDADLSIVFVTDSLDYSSAHPDEFLSFFLSLKGYDRNRVKIHGITGSSSEMGVPCSGTEHGDRYHRLISFTGGSWLDVCTPYEEERAWTDGLWKIGAAASDFVSTFRLGAVPVDQNGDGRVDTEDLEIVVNGEPVNRPGSWSYDPSANAVIFAENYLPPSGASISISYLPGCDP